MRFDLTNSGERVFDFNVFDICAGFTAKHFSTFDSRIVCVFPRIYCLINISFSFGNFSKLDVAPKINIIKNNFPVSEKLSVKK